MLYATAPSLRQVEETAAAATELTVERLPPTAALREERAQWEHAKTEGLDRLARVCMESIVTQVVREEAHEVFWELRRVEQEAESFALHALVYAATARLAKAQALTRAPHVRGQYTVGTLDEGTVVPRALLVNCRNPRRATSRRHAIPPLLKQPRDQSSIT